MSKAADFAKARREVVSSRPKVELQVPHADNKCLYRVSKEGNMEYHYSTEFTVNGEYQGDTYAQHTLSPEEAVKLAEWILKTFK